MSTRPSTESVRRSHLWRWFAALLLVVTAEGAHAQAPGPGSGSIHFTGGVRVIDGDTLEVYIDGHRTGVGIIGINAPMGNTSCGLNATFALWGVVGESDITFEEDPELTFDTRNRRMYYIVLADGSSAAVKMAETGFVRPTGQGREKNQIINAAAGAPKPRCAGR